MFRITSFLAIALAVALAACGDSDNKHGTGAGGSGGAAGSGGSGGTGGDGGTGGQPLAIDYVEVQVDPELICADSCLHIEEGETLKLVATAFDAEGQPLEGVDFTWSTDDDGIATVDASGLVSGVGAGSAQITASAGGKEGSIVVQVGALAVQSIRAFPANADGTPVIVAGKWASFDVTAFADGWGMTPIRDAVIEWTASSDAVEVAEGERSEDGSVRFGLRASEAGVYTVTFTSPGSEAESEASFEVLEATVTAGSFRFDRIAVGGEAACGTDAETGALACWGSNFFGQLALGEETMPAPNPVAPAAPMSFDLLSLSQTSACATDAGGAAWCWGDNYWGQAGLGDDDEPVNMCLQPAPVAGGRSFVSISIGMGHACGVEAGGAAWCWGNNSDGQLGAGAGAADHARAPAAVAGGHAFSIIRAGNSYTCALDLDGKAWCWGASFAPLGADRGEDWNPVTEPTAVAGDHAFVALEVGFSRVCAVDDQGAAWCWGANDAGLLGTGSDEPFVKEPALVQGGHSFRSIAVGGMHTCAIDVAGAAWCWGVNQNGALGDGGLTSSAAPVPVIGDLTFASIDAGGSLTCGVAVDGAGYCWGSSGVGQLGAGLTDTMRPLPTPITSGTCTECVK